MKNKKISKVVGVVAGLSGIAAATSCGPKQDFTIVKDYLIEMPTYKTVDYAFAQDWFVTHPITAGGCSAIVKDIGQESDKHLIVGRNMDFGFSKKCAYIVRTDEPGKYKTLGFAYATNQASPDFEEVKKHGIGDEWYRIMPFFCTDVINEKGLYCEIDMRNIEEDDQGRNKFWCDGTNKDRGLPNVHMVALSRFIVNNCEDVDDAITFVRNNINVFNKEDQWNFSFILADAKGKYGLLEFGHNEIFWEEGQQCQTNYFINGALGTESEEKFGFWRRKYLLDNIGAVTDAKEMFDLMNQVSYSNVYKGLYCPFDMRAEVYDFVSKQDWTKLLSNDEEDIKYCFDNYINPKLKELWKMPEEERRKQSWYWQSTFTEVVDTKNKTIHIRMFEDDNYVFDFQV